MMSTTEIPILGEVAVSSIGRIETLFGNSESLEITDEIKVRAAERGINKKAPFHRNRNSINDAVLVECYHELIADEDPTETVYAFITHNIHDFSTASGDNNEPHPDLLELFANANSHYFIRLIDALKRFREDLVSDLIIENEWVEEPRSFSTVVSAIEELTDKVWYKRHKYWESQILDGKIDLVENESFPIKDHARRPMQRNVWEMAKVAAKKRKHNTVSSRWDHGITLNGE